MRILHVSVLLIALLLASGCAQKEVEPKAEPKKVEKPKPTYSYRYYIHLDGADDPLALASILFECNMLGYEARLEQHPHKNDLYIGPFLSRNSALYSLHQFWSVNPRYTELLVFKRLLSK